eukprot:2236876-Pyramimonas_sp.AAC.1
MFTNLDDSESEEAEKQGLKAIHEELKQFSARVDGYNSDVEKWLQESSDLREAMRQRMKKRKPDE